MLIGVRTNPLRLKSKMPELLEWLAANGFTSVDLPEPDADLAARCRRLGLVPGSVDLPGSAGILSADVERRTAAVRQVREGIQRALDLGLRTWFVCFSPAERTQTRGETFAIWRACMPELAALAEAGGMRIAMEGWPGPGPTYPTIGCTPEMWRAMFAAVPSPALGLCFDPSHLVRLGIDHHRVLREFGSRIHHVHGKDCALDAEARYLHGLLPQTFGKPALACSEGWWRYCIPGDGEVDWRRVAVELAEAGYQGAVSVELEDGMYMQDEDANRQGLRAALAHLNSAWR